MQRTGQCLCGVCRSTTNRNCGNGFKQWISWKTQHSRRSREEESFGTSNRRSRRVTHTGIRLNRREPSIVMSQLLGNSTETATCVRCCGSDATPSASRRCPQSSEPPRLVSRLPSVGEHSNVRKIVEESHTNGVTRLVVAMATSAHPEPRLDGQFRSSLNLTGWTTVPALAVPCRGRETVSIALQTFSHPSLLRQTKK
jgi:hypothetical protein